MFIHDFSYDCSSHLCLGLLSEFFLSGLLPDVFYLLKILWILIMYMYRLWLSYGNCNKACIIIIIIICALSFIPVKICCSVGWQRLWKLKLNTDMFNNADIIIFMNFIYSGTPHLMFLSWGFPLFSIEFHWFLVFCYLSYKLLPFRIFFKLMFRFTAPKQTLSEGFTVLYMSSMQRVLTFLTRLFIYIIVRFSD